MEPNKEAAHVVLHGFTFRHMETGIGLFLGQHPVEIAIVKISRGTHHEHMQGIRTLGALWAYATFRVAAIFSLAAWLAAITKCQGWEFTEDGVKRNTVRKAVRFNSYTNNSSSHSTNPFFVFTVISWK